MLVATHASSQGSPVQPVLDVVPAPTHPKPKPPPPTLQPQEMLTMSNRLFYIRAGFGGKEVHESQLSLRETCVLRGDRTVGLTDGVFFFLIGGRLSPR